MGLANAYVQGYGKIPELFAKIRDGQAPAQFTQQLLKDFGLASSADRSLIPLLKALGFLSPDGKPTPRYHAYRDHSKSKAVMGEALREAYSDVFLIKAHPTKDDRDAIQGKFKSFHNVSDRVAQLMTSTFFSLLGLADLGVKPKATSTKKDQPQDEDEMPKGDETPPDSRPAGQPSLHYNIQIHLPATKDVEVYNAIFKALREHLFEA